MTEPGLEAPCFTATWRVRFVIAWLAAFLAAIHAPPCPADHGIQDVPWSRRAVDLVRTSDGLRLLGSVIGRHRDGSVDLVVEREWLAERYAKRYELWLKGRTERNQRALEELQSRIDGWLAERADDKPLVAFLNDQRQRVAADLKDVAAVPLPRFLLLEITPDRVQNVVLQAAARRSILHLAWSEKLRDVSSRSSSALVRELRDRGVDPNRPVDLSGELPIAADDDRQWAARVALVEYRLRKPLDFQGTGDFVLAAGAGAPVNVNELLGKVLGADGKMIHQLLGGGAPPVDEEKTDDMAWLESVAKTCREQGVRGALVQRLTSRLGAKQVVVDVHFVAVMPDDTFVPVVHFTQTATVGKARPDAQQQILNDPQVKQVIELLEGMGLAAGGPQLEMALNHGAATQEAKQEADRRFTEYQERFLRALDRPAMTSLEN